MTITINETYTLSNGVKIPKLGLGTWLINDTQVADFLHQAIQIGYRHIDTAQAYHNERGIGVGIRNSGINRSDLFVTTKLDAGIKSYAEAVKAIDGSLQKMKLDYLDLMLIHSPKPWIDYAGTDNFFEGNREAWRALEDAYKAGKLRSLGLSNFEREDSDNIIENCTIKPMVNQILAHIGNTPFDLIEYSASQNILLQAYSPMAHGETLTNKEIIAMANKYDVSVPQLCLRYCLQLNMIPLPKTGNIEHMRTNASVDFVIDEADMEILKNVNPITDCPETNIFRVYRGKVRVDSTTQAETNKLILKRIHSFE